MRSLQRVSIVTAVCVLTCHGLAGEFPLEQWKSWQEPPARRVPHRNWLQYATPEEAGWSSEKLAQARACFDSLESAAAMVIYDGAVLAAWGEIDRRFPCHSVRKSLLNALYGIHVAEGRIDLEETLGELEISDAPALMPSELEARIVDLLKSRSGVYHSAAYETRKMRETRPARGCHRPDEVFWYNNWGFNALATIFEKESGTRVFEEFHDRFAVPLGMEDFGVRDGYYHLEEEHSIHPAYPFCMSARDLARLGLLFLREGRWDDCQILSKQWIRDSTRSYLTDTDTNSDSRYGYGYLWWPVVDGPFMELGTYSARGSGGHAIDVIPAAKLVLVHRVNTFPNVCSFSGLDRKRVKNDERFELLRMILEARAAAPAPEPNLIPLGTSRTPVRKVELETATLDRYQKLFEFDSFQLRVTRIDDGLRIGQPGKSAHRLLPLSPEQFFIEDVELPLRFRLDENGEPTGMTITQGPDKKLTGRAAAFDR